MTFSNSKKTVIILLSDVIVGFNSLGSNSNILKIIVILAITSIENEGTNNNINYF